MGNYTKRIENRIRKHGDTYVLTTHRIFVPNKNSKKNFRSPSVDAINCLVTTYGTPPAHRDLKVIYEDAISSYYGTMANYKKFKKKINRRNRLRKVS